MRRNKKKRIFLFVGRVEEWDEIVSKRNQFWGDGKSVIAIFHAFMPSHRCRCRRRWDGKLGNEEMTLKCFCWFVYRLIAFNLSILLNFPLRFIKRKKNSCLKLDADRARIIWYFGKFGWSMDHPALGLILKYNFINGWAAIHNSIRMLMTFHFPFDYAVPWSLNQGSFPFPRLLNCLLSDLIFLHPVIYVGIFLCSGTDKKAEKTRNYY